MPDYQNGKIYKITSGELTYIGSTCEPTLARRLAGHVGLCKSWKEGKKNYITSFQLIETGQYEITLIELFPCGSKDELTARERFHIETNKCVNKNIPMRSKAEWREVNKETLSEKKKAYYEANKEVFLEKQKAYNEANKEARKAYLEANKETLSEKKKEWYKAKKALTLD